MKCYDKINEVFQAIYADSKYEAISNEFFVWKDSNKFIIEDESNSKKGWRIFWHKNVVRALRILKTHNLIDSPFYKVFVGHDFLRIDVEKTVKIQSVFNYDYQTVLANCKKIQKLLFCKSKIEQEELDGNTKVQIWIYPNQKINGILIRVDKRMNKLFREIVDFAKLNSIEIILGQDENHFLQNPIAKEKLAWEDYIFDYQTGVCFILFERSSYSNITFGQYPYIKKVPEILWNNAEKLKYQILNESDQDYLQLAYGFDGFDEWKSAIITYLKEKNDYYEYLFERDKDCIIKSNQIDMSSNSEWKSDFDNPYYNSDIEADEQSQEYWDSI